MVKAPITKYSFMECKVITLFRRLILRYYKIQLIEIWKIDNLIGDGS